MLPSLAGEGGTGWAAACQPPPTCLHPLCKEKLVASVSSKPLRGERFDLQQKVPSSSWLTNTVSSEWMQIPPPGADQRPAACLASALVPLQGSGPPPKMGHHWASRPLTQAASRCCWASLRVPGALSSPQGLRPAPGRRDDTRERWAQDTVASTAPRGLHGKRSLLLIPGAVSRTLL